MEARLTDSGSELCVSGLSHRVPRRARAYLVFVAVSDDGEASRDTVMKGGACRVNSGQSPGARNVHFAPRSEDAAEVYIWNLAKGMSERTARLNK